MVLPMSNAFQRRKSLEGVLIGKQNRKQQAVVCRLTCSLSVLSWRPLRMAGEKAVGKSNLIDKQQAEEKAEKPGRQSEMRAEFGVVPAIKNKD
jgi:hypothetical protein